MAGHVKTCREWDQLIKEGWDGRRRRKMGDCFHMLLRPTVVVYGYLHNFDIILMMKKKKKRWVCFFFFLFFLLLSSIRLFGSKRFHLFCFQTKVLGRSFSLEDMISKCFFFFPILLNLNLNLIDNPLFNESV